MRPESTYFGCYLRANDHALNTTPTRNLIHHLTCVFGSKAVADTMALEKGQISEQSCNNAIIQGVLRKAPNNLPICVGMFNIRVFIHRRSITSIRSLIDEHLLKRQYTRMEMAGNMTGHVNFIIVFPKRYSMHQKWKAVKTIAKRTWIMKTRSFRIHHSRKYKFIIWKTVPFS